MRQMGLSSVRFLDDHKGSAAIEYALIATGIAVAIVTVVSGIGNELNLLFEDVEASFPDAE
jgi:pilus assembly protein Flp/PilA